VVIPLLSDFAGQVKQGNGVGSACALLLRAAPLPLPVFDHTICEIVFQHPAVVSPGRPEKHMKGGEVIEL
jgi:hypothetical protein